MNKRICAASILAAMLATALAAMVVSSGCVDNAQGTTRPTPPDLVAMTSTEALVVKGIEDGVTLGLQTHLISGQTYATRIDPLFTAANKALTDMQAAADTNNQTGWQAADTALMTNLAAMQPFITAATKGK